MKVVRIIDGEPTLTDAPMPADPNQFRVKVAAVGICGSDLHMIDNGMAEGRVLGHEISGRLDDGTPVAVEPLRSCGHCGNCREGERHRCDAGADIIGVFSDGGMGEYLMAPAEALVRLASGIEVTDASLVENLAVAVHAVNRARMQSGERVGIIGAGPIGLATAAALRRAGFDADISARHEHQADAAQSVGANVGVGDGYDVVFDAVGSTSSLHESVRRCRYGGRVCMVGSFWDPVELDMTILMAEVTLVPAMMYSRTAAGREISSAAALLADMLQLGDALISHRYPLDAAPEAFAAARDRSSGAIKVVFEPHA